MKHKRFNIAFEKAKEVNEKLHNMFRDEYFIPLNAIIEVVKSISEYSVIEVYRQSFDSVIGKEANKPQNKYGAMLSTCSIKNQDREVEESKAILIVNSDFDANMQRFSVVHELGHLITKDANFEYESKDDGKFTLSAHVNPDITFITDEECEKSNYLIAEQVANIFALMVLIPNDIKMSDIKSIGVKELATRYGVTEDAVYSRFLLSNVRR